MSRPERIEYEGAYYHVMNRGRHRDDIFHGKEYYEAFLETLAEAVLRFGLEIHAYCLMSNHYHLLVSTPNGNLQRAMRHIGGIYTQRYNRLKSTDGSLFRGRYKAILVDSDEYLLHVSKYIHLNPVEAKMVDELDTYKWSSYPAYSGKCRATSWLTMNELYAQLTDKRNKAQRYRFYVEEIESSDEILNFYSKRRVMPVLGSQCFKDEVVALTGNVNRSEEVPRKERLVSTPSLNRVVDEVADFYGVDKASVLVLKRGRGLKNFPRKVAMCLSQVKGQYKLTEIADYFGMKHYGGVASAISDVRKKMNESRSIKKQLNSIVKRLDP